MKAQELISTIRNNFEGCDLLLSLFISALHTYRVDNCLRPFPRKYYASNGEKNIDELRKICDNIPTLKDILNVNINTSNGEISLLNWLFLENNQRSLKKANAQVLPDSVDITITPHYVFSVTYSPQLEDNWQKRKGYKNSFYAFHGSKLENFYSIFKVGLQQHFSIGKNVLFGQGIYLTTEMSLSTLYSPYGISWKNSIYGNKISIIALCEVIDDVDKVKYYDPKNKSRAKNEDSLGNITEKYFVVRDSDMVRLKYLLLYKQTRHSKKSWMYNNWFIIILLLYGLMLLSIGFVRSSSYKYMKFILFDQFFSSNEI